MRDEAVPTLHPILYLYKHKVAHMNREVDRPIPKQLESVLKETDDLAVLSNYLRTSTLPAGASLGQRKPAPQSTDDEAIAGKVR